jgi:hypothetical protein
MTYFVAQFEPQILFVEKLPGAAKAVLRSTKAPHWGTNAQTYTIRHTSLKYIYILDHHSVIIQSLSVSALQDHLEMHQLALAGALGNMGIDKLRKLTLKLEVQIPLGMEHSQIFDLWSGAFLPNADLLAPIELEDGLIQLHGTLGEKKLMLVAAPQTAEQSARRFLGNPNLSFFDDNVMISDTIMKRHSLVNEDSLAVTIEVTQESVPSGKVVPFIRAGLTAAEELIETTMRILHSRPRSANG